MVDFGLTGELVADSINEPQQTSLNAKGTFEYARRPECEDC